MRLKSELYREEQEAIVDAIVEILDLNNKKVFTLHEWDNDTAIQTRILELIPNIRRWYSCNRLKAVTDPERIRRPWLSIIKQLTKNRYTIKCKARHFKVDGQWLVTQQYTFSGGTYV